MSLLQFLSRLPTDQLRRIARTTGLHTTSTSKQGLISTIGFHFQQRPFISQLVGNLPNDQQFALRFFFQRGLNNSELSHLVEVLRESAMAGDGERALAALEGLFDHGLLLRAGSRNGTEVSVPSDLAETLRSALNELSRDNSASAIETPETVALAQPLMQRNMLHLLGQALHQPPRLTRGRELYLRAKRRLLGVMHPMALPHPPDKPPPRNPCAPDQAETSLQMCLAVLHAAKLIRIQNLHYHPSRKCMALAKSTEMRLHQRLWHGFMRSFVESTLLNSILYHAMQEQFQDDKWYDIQAVMNDALNNFPRFYHAEPPSVGGYRFLEYLWAMGVLDVGWVGETAYARLTTLGRWLTSEDAPPPAFEERPLTLMPDFRLMVPATAPLTTLWKIELFTDLERSDVVLTYAISKQSVYRGMQTGLEIPGLLAQLEEWTGKTLPQNVRYSMQSWGEQYNRVSFHDVLLLRCDTAELAEELQAIPALKQFIKGRVTARHLVIQPDKYEKVSALLEELDYMPGPLHTDAPMEEN